MTEEHQDLFKSTLLTVGRSVTKKSYCSTQVAQQLPKTVAVEVAMECSSAKRTRLAAVEAAKEAHVYPVTLDPGQVTVTEQLIFAGECAKEAAAAERALMMTAQEARDQTKIETLAAANRRRAEENADKIAADQTTLAAANRRRSEETADKIAAVQTKINCASSLCGAEGCGKRNIGNFLKHVLMVRQLRHHLLQPHLGWKERVARE